MYENSRKYLEAHGIHYECNKCSFKTKDKAQFLKHKTTMHLNVVFKCESCNYESESKDELKTHIDDVHESIEVVVENEEESKKKPNHVYCCLHCEFQMNGKNKLKDHIEKEHSQKATLGSFKCNICDYVGVKQDNLAQHKRMEHVRK